MGILNLEVIQTEVANIRAAMLSKSGLPQAEHVHRSAEPAARGSDPAIDSTNERLGNRRQAKQHPLIALLTEFPPLIKYFADKRGYLHQRGRGSGPVQQRHR